jgi:GcrA cell cycle regulator
MAKNATDSDWTADVRQEFVLAWGLGWAISKISRHLSEKYGCDFSRNAVAGKRRRMDLPERGTPIGRTQVKVDRVPKPRVRKVSKRSVDVVAPLSTVVNFAARSHRLPRPGSVCCWPIGEPGRHGFRFCDVPLDQYGEYCAEHRAIAYVPRRKAA